MSAETELTPVRPAPWNCPECGGPWIRNFVFQHKANACTLLDSEDRMQAADYLNGHNLSAGRYYRPASVAEVALYNVIASEPLTGDLVMTELIEAGAIRTRIVAGLNPDNYNL
ncbi:hypothetical protein [Glutamicibacter halophytocola]|uniref:hypothetical protein n=1 Tax=Glutamicibacter halophytocola TaxID=1933880 RepID=UPI0015C52491|nr:hypothetical protein [Glutamicibacter halophytocola]NQD42437.1 hypothetical protein [Glutamicibacter halophytocola]